MEIGCHRDTKLIDNLLIVGEVISDKYRLVATRKSRGCDCATTVNIVHIHGRLHMRFSLRG